MIASVLADLSFLLIVPLLHQQGMLPVWAWISSFTADLLLTAAVVAGFRWVRNDAGAAAIASAGYTVLQAVNRVVFLELFLHGPHSPAVFLVYCCSPISSSCSSWPWRCAGSSPPGSACGSAPPRPRSPRRWCTASAAFLYNRLSEQFSFPFSFGPWDVVQDLLFAAVFAFTFWGGLALFAPKVLRD